MSETFDIGELWGIVSIHLAKIEDKIRLMMTCKYIYKTNQIFDKSISEFNLFKKFCIEKEKKNKLGYAFEWGWSCMLDLIYDGETEEVLPFMASMIKFAKNDSFGERIDIYEDIKIATEVTAIKGEPKKLIRLLRHIGFKDILYFCELLEYLGYHEKLPRTGSAFVYAFLEKYKEMFHETPKVLRIENRPKNIEDARKELSEFGF